MTELPSMLLMQSIVKSAQLLGMGMPSGIQLGPMLT
jgi:hypothetical protein